MMSPIVGRLTMSILNTFNLNRLTVFIAVIEAGTITAAAERLGMSKAMVSTHLQKLESELGVSLLGRTTRQVKPTEAGSAFYEASRDVLERAEQAIAVARDGETVRGMLRVGCPIDFGALVLAPMLVDLRVRYPELLVELVSNERRVDLIAENVDVAIHFGTLPDSTHRSVTVGRFEKWLVASPELARSLPAYPMPAQLASMPFVGFSAQPKPLAVSLISHRGERADIEFERGFVADSSAACRSAALAGGGLAFLTRCSVAKNIAEGRLVRILPEWASPIGDVHAVLPPTKYRGEKVRVFLDALRAHAADAFEEAAA